MVRRVNVTTAERNCVKGAMWATRRARRPREGTDKRKQGKGTSLLFGGLQERQELRSWS